MYLVNIMFFLWTPDLNGWALSLYLLFTYRYNFHIYTRIFRLGSHAALLCIHIRHHAYITVVSLYRWLDSLEYIAFSLYSVYRLHAVQGRMYAAIYYPNFAQIMSIVSQEIRMSSQIISNRKQISLVLMKNKQILRYNIQILQLLCTLLLGV